jgi:hypothetical protein
LRSDSFWESCLLPGGLVISGFVREHPRAVLVGYDRVFSLHPQETEFRRTVPLY